MVRRHPDIKWLRRPSDIAGFAQQQLAILNALWRLLDGGGKLLYATCSIFAQENQQVIAEFLQQHKDAYQRTEDITSDLAVVLGQTGRMASSSIRGQRTDNDEEQVSTGQLLPNEQHDGFFYALLSKQGTADT